MKHLTPEGTNDGYILRRMKDVFRVDLDGEYERKLQLLYTLQKQEHKDFITEEVTEDSDLFRESLAIAMQKKLISTICIDETEEQEALFGFVTSIGSEEATILQVFNDGTSDGESIFYLEDLVKINCDTVENRLVKLLYDYKQKQL